MSHDEELRWVRRHERTHRSGSRANPGYERDLLREDDTENLLGPTESRPADIDEIVRSRRPPTPPQPILGEEFRYQLGDAIMDALAPYIERGVDVAVDAAVLGISRLWRWATVKPSERTRTVGRENKSERFDAKAEALPVADAVDTHETSEAIALKPRSMTAEQYQAILLSALLADQYAAHARKMLANVRIHDEALPVELERAIKAALDGPTPVVDDATLAQVVELLRESKAPGGEFVLVRSQRVDAPLPISDGKKQQG